MATKKFNANKCDLDEMNRELKRLASRKCRAKTEQAFNEADAEYKRLVAIKNKRFATARKSYMTFTPDEIAQLDLETTVKAIKSLQSTRCLYPKRKAEVLEVEAVYRAHKDELVELAKFNELKAKFS